MDDDLLKISLKQGNQFNKYQDNIKRLKRKMASVKEGFVSSSNPEIPNTNTNTNTNANTNANITELRQLQNNYDKLMKEYILLQKSMKKSSLETINRLSSNNPYLGKNLLFTDGTICYVTHQGVAKPYTNEDIYNNTIGKNGCSSELVKLTIPWTSSYIKGSTIPTNPTLIVGTPMIKGKSCGAEGKNVYASKLINNPSSEYIGCYNDKPPSTNILVVPILSSDAGSNGFVPYASSIYLNNARCGAWAAFDQNPNTLWHSGVNSSNIYNATTGVYEGSNGKDIASIGRVKGEYLAINMPGVNTPSAKNITVTQYSLAPRIDLASTRSPNSWYVIGWKNNQWHKVDRQIDQSFNSSSAKTYNVLTPGAYSAYMLLIDKVGNNDQKINRYCVQVAGWNLFTNSDSSFTDDKRSMILNTSAINYTSFDNCQQYAVDNGYQYFGLQDYQTNGTAQCLVSNDITRTKIYGDASKQLTQIPIWSSNTSKQTSILSAQLAGMGQMIIYDINGAVVYRTNPEVQGCSSWGTIVVDSATYGGNCGVPIGNVTNKVANDLKCNWKERCTIPISNATFGDTAKKCKKSFDVSYKCGGTPFTRNLAQAEGQTMILDCSEHIAKECKFYLILQDDGNLCIYKGTDPSNNKGSVWCSQTNGKQKMANPNWVSSKGKFGRNYLKTGDILGPDEWIGSNNGALKLIMQSDGNLVLYTSENNSGCIKASNGKTVGKSWVNAVYKLNASGNKNSLGKVGYIDSESNLKEYPSSMLSLSNEYQIYQNTDSTGNNISTTTVSNQNGCQDLCNNNANCTSYAYQNSTSTCWIKNGSTISKQTNNGMTLGIRKPKLNNSAICSNEIVDIDTIQYDNYKKGSIMSANTKCNSSVVSKEDNKKLENILSQLTILGKDIASKMEKLYNEDNRIYEKLNTNHDQFKSDLEKYKNIQYKIDTELKIQSNNIEGMRNINDINGMLTDSDLIVLQENYKYIFWSILAVGTLTIAINTMK
jgi:hypothetical protein